VTVIIDLDNQTTDNHPRCRQLTSQTSQSSAQNIYNKRHDRIV